jgi:hypothetical protein
VPLTDAQVRAARLASGNGNGRAAVAAAAAAAEVPVYTRSGPDCRLTSLHPRLHAAMLKAAARPLSGDDLPDDCDEDR